MSDAKRLVGLVIAFLIVWTLNTLAMAFYLEGQSLLDLMYAGLQLFVVSLPTAKVPDGADPKDLPFLLHLMRFIAPLFAVTALIMGLAGAAWDYLAAIEARIRRRPHVVIIGYGEVGRALVESLRERDPDARIVCLDRKVSQADQNLIRKYRGRLFEVDAFDRKARTSFLVGMDRMARTPLFGKDRKESPAREVYVACGSDEQTLSVVSDIDEARAEALAKNPKHPINPTFFHLGSARFAEKLRNTPGLRSEPFEIARYSIEDVIDRFCLPMLARASFQSRVHVVIHGCEDNAMMALEEALLTGIMPAPTFLPPRVTLICAGAEEARQRWEARQFGAAGQFDVEFKELPPDGMPGPCADEDPYAQTESQLPVTLHLIAFEDDRIALAYSLSLREMMRREYRQSAPIAALSGAATSHITGLAEVSNVSQLRFEVCGDSVAAAKRSFICTTEIQELSKAIHAGYLRQVPGAEEFENLPYSLKLSNRRAAVHMLVKLRLLGFEALDPYKPGFNLSPPARDWVKALPSDVDQMVHIETHEHLRWRFDRLLEGWRNGVRDEDRMLRDQLGEETVSKITHEHAQKSRQARLNRVETEKDSAQVASLDRYLVDACKRSEQGHARRIVTKPWTGDPPHWVVEGDTPKLVFDHAPADWRVWAKETWPEITEENELRVQILLPAAPPLPNLRPGEERKPLLAAYCDFANHLAVSGHRFRLARPDTLIWNWLPRERLSKAAVERVDGTLLHALTIGITGNRDIGEIADLETVKGELIELFNRLNVPGRTTLITGGAPHFDAIALEAFHASDAGKTGGTSLLLHPYEVDGKPAWHKTPDSQIDEKQMALATSVEPVPNADLGHDESAKPHVNLANSMLDRCTYLIAMSDGVDGGDGGAVDTVKRAEARHMLVWHRIVRREEEDTQA